VTEPAIVRSPSIAKRYRAARARIGAELAAGRGRAMTGAVIAGAAR